MRTKQSLPTLIRSVLQKNTPKKLRNHTRNDFQFSSDKIKVVNLFKLKRFVYEHNRNQTRTPQPY
jgi:hypothetical protein